MKVQYDASLILCIAFRQPPVAKKAPSPAPGHAASPGPVETESNQARPSESKPPAAATAASEPVPESKPAADIGGPKPNAYVPPHLRKRGGAS